MNLLATWSTESKVSLAVMVLVILAFACDVIPWRRKR